MPVPKSDHPVGPTGAPAPSTSAFPFVCRQKETARLCQLHAQRRHVLIVGPAGVGKTALVAQLRERLRLLISPGSAHLGGLCEGLEPQLSLGPAGLKLLARKQRLREALAAAAHRSVRRGELDHAQAEFVY